MRHREWTSLLSYFPLQLQGNFKSVIDQVHSLAPAKIQAHGQTPALVEICPKSAVV